MNWTINLYPSRLWTIERRAIRHRLVVVIRKRRETKDTWVQILARAA